MELEKFDKAMEMSGICRS